MPLNLRLPIVAALLLSGSLARSAESKANPAPAPAAPVNATPAECWERLTTATTIANRLACLTESTQCMTVGQVAAEVERLIFFNAPERKEAEALLMEHGLGDIEIMGNLQQAIRPGTEGPILVEIGAWSRNATGFLSAATKLLRKHSLGEIERTKAHIAKLSATFAKRIKDAKDKTEIEQLEDERDDKLARQNEYLERQQALAEVYQDQPEKEKTERVAPKLIDVKISDDTAMAGVAGEPQSKVFFKKELGSWRLANAEKEPPVLRPSDTVRALRRFAARGRWKDEQVGGRAAEALPVFKGYSYAGDDRVRSALGDDDVSALAALMSLESLELRGSSQLTPKGWAQLANFSKLSELTIREMTLTDEALKALARHETLQSLTLQNAIFSDAALDTFRQTSPQCKIREFYTIFGNNFDEEVNRLNRGKVLEEEVRRVADLAAARERDRPAILMVAHGLPFALPEDSLKEQKQRFVEVDPSARELFRLVAKNRVQLLRDWPWHVEKQPNWWKDRPYLAPNTTPQVVVFAPGQNKGEILTGDITAVRVLAALRKAVQAEEPKK